MENKKLNFSDQVSSGVESLIQHLRDDGVNAGRVEAQALVDQAKTKADQLVADAEQKALDIVRKAEAEARKIKMAGHDALNIAMRDILLKLKAQLSDLVGKRVQYLISAQLDQEAFLKELILELAAKVKTGASLDKSPSLDFKLPQSFVGLDDLRRNPLELSEGSLSHFILNVAADVLRDGVSFSDSHEGFSGLKVYLKDSDVIVEFSDESLSAILLQHLQPRFRAILEGMVK